MAQGTRIVRAVKKKDGRMAGGAEKAGVGVGGGGCRFARISLWPLRGGSCLGFVI